MTLCIECGKEWSPQTPHPKCDSQTWVSVGRCNYDGYLLDEARADTKEAWKAYRELAQSRLLHQDRTDYRMDRLWRQLAQLNKEGE